MARRVIIYGGFHKTGTTSAQKALDANATILQRHVDVFLRGDMLELCEATRAASSDLTPTRLDALHAEIASMADILSARRSKPALLASEDLAGHMPGRQGITSYGTSTPTLMAALADGFAQFDVTFLFSTRASDPWLKSCYAQHLQYTRMTMTHAQYQSLYGVSAKLDDVVVHIRDRVKCQVVSTALEHTGATRFGPLTPILDLLDLPADVIETLQAPVRHNTSPPDDVLDELLTLNQSDLRGPALGNAKKKIRRRLRLARKSNA